MSLGKIFLIVAACLQYIMCYAEDECIAYDQSDQSIQKVTAVNSMHECFLACVANSKCLSFEYDGVCTIYVFYSPIHRSDGYYDVFIRCSYNSTQCSAYPNENVADDDSQTTTFNIALEDGYPCDTAVSKLK
ncbi:uncharacterized protein LOC131948410 [Physella acuta]|uniref:uncharacterized protein LOC131948410 n=1 Tax=Physella acuta TaxID=109671 RepID=UPI0027DEA96C|nr:uncharacterized protein LOC131948410 [Physella acuta]